MYFFFLILYISRKVLCESKRIKKKKLKVILRSKSIESQSGYLKIKMEDRYRLKIA